LPAALLHSELPTWERKKTLQALERQQLRLLYLSPETLLSAPVWERLCQPHLKVNGLILDYVILKNLIQQQQQQQIFALLCKDKLVQT
jgi:hypothetical protein